MLRHPLSGKLTEVLVTSSANAQTLKRTYNYEAYQTTDGAEHELLDWSEEQDEAGSPTTTKVYDYDETAQLTRASAYNGAGTLTGRQTFTIDAYGNRTKRERFNGTSTATRTYAYNIGNQLCWYADLTSTNGCGTPPTGATTFTYDQDGNQLTGGTNATYDDKGRVATLGGSAMTHLSSTNAELTGLGSSTFQNTLLGVSTITVSGNVSRIQRS